MVELRLHRPERRNALDDGTVDALLDTLRDEGPDARCVVLTGGDDFFSAGGDVGTMPSGGTADLFGAAARLTRVHDVVSELRAAGTVTVAAVEGYAIGVAWGLVLACDLVVAADDAYFSAPFTQRGLAADGGTAWHLVRRLGRHRANRHLLLGERLAAPDAADAGLVSLLCAPGAATTTAHDVAGRLAAGPAGAMAVTAWMCHVAEDRALEPFLREERVGVALAGHGADAAEGRAAFAERRDPEFLR